MFDIFKNFKALIENLSGNIIKVLRTDNGKEYVNKKLQQVCDENDIQMKQYVPYTPQQKGVEEHKNRTLKEMATCMLEDKYLYHKIWYKAINCCAYVQNKFTQSIGRENSI